jgi:hypothetical protein
MKARIYDVAKNGLTQFQVFSVDENGEEKIVSTHIYDHSKNPEVWGKDKTYKEALESARWVELNLNSSGLVYETGSDNNQ